jgi:type IV pilus assembly protein PilA
VVLLRQPEFHALPRASRPRSSRQIRFEWKGRERKAFSPLFSWLRLDKVLNMPNAKRQLNGARGVRDVRGFSLIELLIVVAIILIIASIAIPSYLRSRMAANEAGAAENIRAMTTAATIYFTTWGNGYPPSLTALGGTAIGATCDLAELLDPLMTTAPFKRSGYKYGYTGIGAPVTKPAGCGAPGYNAYLATATPIIPGSTGQRSFCSTVPGVIHFDLTGVTAASSAACDALPNL